MSRACSFAASVLTKKFAFHGREWFIGIGAMRIVIRPNIAGLDPFLRGRGIA